MSFACLDPADDLRVSFVVDHGSASEVMDAGGLYTFRVVWQALSSDFSATEYRQCYSKFHPWPRM